MKSNEIVQEGPLNFMGKLAAGTAGLVSGGTAGASAGYQQKAQEQRLNKYVSQFFPNLNSTIVNLKAQGLQPNDMSKRIQAWATKYFKIQAPPPPPGENPKQMQEWLKKVIAQWLTRDAEGPEGAPTTGNVSTNGTQANTAPTTTTVSSGNTKVQSSNVSPTGNATTAANTTVTSTTTADPAHAMFKDPASFKAEWDKFMSANPNFKLITNPELLSVLKNMWMRTGGTKTESKNNKGTRV